MLEDNLGVRAVFRHRLGFVLVCAGLAGVACQAPALHEPGAIERHSAPKDAPSPALAAAPPELAAPSLQQEPHPASRYGKDQRVELGANGQIAVQDGAQIQVFSRDGIQLGQLRAGSVARRHRLFSSGVLVPRVAQAGVHDETLLGYELRSFDDELLVSFPVTQVRFMRPSAEHLVAVEQDRISRWTALGEPVWSVPLTAHELVSALDQDVQVLIDGRDARRVLHLTQGQISAEFSCRSALWNVAVSQNGRYSAATTQNALHRFDSGRWLGSTQLSDAYATSLAVSNDGYVLLGTQDLDHWGSVTLYAGALTRNAPDAVTARWELGHDVDAFHPKVQFLDANQFTLEHAQSLYTGTLSGLTLPTVRNVAAGEESL